MNIRNTIHSTIAPLRLSRVDCAFIAMNADMRAWAIAGMICPRR